MLSAAVSLAFASFLCSYCNTNDVSWGNRPGGAHAVSADVAAQDRRFRSFRSMLVVLCKYADFEPNFKLNRPQPLTFGTFFFSLYAAPPSPPCRARLELDLIAGPSNSRRKFYPYLLWLHGALSSPSLRLPV